ncbi:MAG: hypothetical protein ACT4PJ_11305 [Gemmatimonadaceae bacterium]
MPTPTEKSSQDVADGFFVLDDEKGDRGGAPGLLGTGIEVDHA